MDSLEFSSWSFRTLKLLFRQGRRLNHWWAISSYIFIFHKIIHCLLNDNGLWPWYICSYLYQTGVGRFSAHGLAPGSCLPWGQLKWLLQQQFWSTMRGWGWNKKVHNRHSILSVLINTTPAKTTGLALLISLPSHCTCHTGRSSGMTTQWWWALWEDRLSPTEQSSWSLRLPMRGTIIESSAYWGWAWIFIMLSVIEFTAQWIHFWSLKLGQNPSSSQFSLHRFSLNKEPAQAPTCPLCGTFCPSLYHRFWLCPSMSAF